MDLVFIISAYKLPEQLIRLVQRLQAPGATFLIHVDRRAPREVTARMHEGLARMAGVQFLPSHDCYWGDFGHVEASLKGLRAIVRQRIPCEYAVLLTGQDYPIKPHREIFATLASGKGHSFLTHFALPSSVWPEQGMARIERWHLRIFGRYLPFPRNAGDRHARWLPRFVDRLLPAKRAFLPGLAPHGGGGYWCLSAEAVHFVHRYVEEHPRYVHFFRSVYIPDEIFFQTILLNSPLRARIICEDLRYIDWTDPRPGRFPAILEMKDLPHLRTSAKLFARKFDATVDGEILDRIDECCLGLPAKT